MELATLLVIWIVTGAILGGLVTPLVLRRKDHPRPRRGILPGVVAGGIGHIVLLAPLWFSLLRRGTERKTPDSAPSPPPVPTPPHPDRPRIALLRALEAAIVGLFLIQGVRFAYATLYAHASSADRYDGTVALYNDILAQHEQTLNALVSAPDRHRQYEQEVYEPIRRALDFDALKNAPGVVESSTVQGEIAVLVGMLFLPLLALILSRWRLSFGIAVILVALGRSMALQVSGVEIPATGLVIGAGLLYMALTIIRRPTYFPVMILLGFTAEQVIRALGDTYDYTWRNDYAVELPQGFNIGMELLISLASIALILFTILVWFVERREAHRQTQPPPRGLLNVWSGLALGGVFFLEFTLLSLPNAVAHWAETDYAGMVPWLIAATALPLVPEVRDLARRFAGMFDGAWRGWLWGLLLGLLLVVGRRYHGILAGIALVLAQFIVGLTLWWFVQMGLPRRNATGITILVSIAGFAALAIGDYFTYDYAYVRDMAAPYQNVDDVLRAFRDMGLGLALIAALVASTPMILARRWIPWRGGPTSFTLSALGLIVVASVIAVTAASEDTVRRPVSANCLRIASFNIHGGYSQFFEPNLEQVADLIELNGADIVLLQEVETGRMASFGVDQVLWLARRLDMDAEFFAQNEALQGLAVLSRVPITDVEGLLLESDGNQAGILYVGLDPERLVDDPQAANIGKLHVYNTWLGHFIKERDGIPVPPEEQDQTKQLNTILDWLIVRHSATKPEEADRVILGGTFNFEPDSPLYARLSQDTGIQDPLAGYENMETFFHVYAPDYNDNADLTVLCKHHEDLCERYDYVWTFDVPLFGAMVDQSPEAADTSDHRSVIVAFKRRRPFEGEQELVCQ